MRWQQTFDWLAGKHRALLWFLPLHSPSSDCWVNIGEDAAALMVLTARILVIFLCSACFNFGGGKCTIRGLLRQITKLQSQGWRGNPFVCGWGLTKEFECLLHNTLLHIQALYLNDASKGKNNARLQVLFWNERSQKWDPLTCLVNYTWMKSVNIYPDIKNQDHVPDFVCLGMCFSFNLEAIIVKLNDH